jgi:hypothetical protein
VTVSGSGKADGDAPEQRTRPKRWPALSIPSRALRQDFFWTWITLTMLNGMDLAVDRLGLPAEANPLSSLVAIRPSLEQRRQPVLARFFIRIANRALKATYRPGRPPELGKSQRIVFQSLRYSLELVWWLRWLGNAAPCYLTGIAVLLALIFHPG